MKGEKKLFPIGDVRFINVPKYPELAVRKMMDLIRDDEMLVEYFPNNIEKKRTIDRDWYFNIINTVHPGFLDQLIRHG